MTYTLLKAVAPLVDGYEEAPEEYITITVEEDFDLAVVGCTGEHSKLEKILLGTVAEAVVNNAPCDVLIVR